MSKSNWRRLLGSLIYALGQRLGVEFWVRALGKGYIQRSGDKVTVIGQVEFRLRDLGLWLWLDGIELG